MIVTLLCLIVATAAAIGGYYSWLRDSSLVAVKNVEIRGVPATNKGAIERALTTSAKEMTTLHMDNQRLHKAVANWPEIKKFAIQVDFPNTVKINVEQRHPVAILTHGSNRIPVARDGVLLPDIKPRTNLPLIPMSTLPAGKQLENKIALRDIAVLSAAPSALSLEVAKIDSGEKGITVQLSNGIELYFGTLEHIAEKWTAAARVLADPSAAGAIYIDLRVPGRPAVGGQGPPPTPSEP
jgi:cell division protein FtsQ